MAHTIFFLLQLLKSASSSTPSQYLVFCLGQIKKSLLSDFFPGETCPVSVQREFGRHVLAFSNLSFEIWSSFLLMNFLFQNLPCVFLFYSILTVSFSLTCSFPVSCSFLYVIPTSYYTFCLPANQTSLFLDVRTQQQLFQVQNEACYRTAILMLHLY